jgi:hypothetical protein
MAALLARCADPSRSGRYISGACEDPARSRKDGTGPRPRRQVLRPAGPRLLCLNPLLLTFLGGQL